MHDPQMPERSTGTVDDFDDPDDERDDENEAPVRETDDATELPEEMEVDDEDADEEDYDSEDFDIDESDDE